MKFLNFFSSFFFWSSPNFAFAKWDISKNFSYSFLPWFLFHTIEPSVINIISALNAMAYNHRTYKSALVHMDYALGIRIFAISVIFFLHWMNKEGPLETRIIIILFTGVLYT